MRLTRRTLLAGTAAVPLAGATVMPAVASSGGGVSVKDRINELVDRYHDGVAPIVALGQMVLRRQAVRFDGQVDDSVLLAFTELLRRTNKVAPGVGLAAPQVGVPVQIAVMEDPAPVPAEIAEARQRYPLEYFAAINPEYRPVGSKRRGFFEGCLSMPGWAGVVNRPLSVQATYLDVAGQVRRRAFDGWQARIVQHEFDHLRGVVYVDKVEPRSLSTIEAYLANWSQPVPTKAARELGFRLD